MLGARTPRRGGPGGLPQVCASYDDRRIRPAIQRPARRVQGGSVTRRTKRPRWPWPEDSTLDRARRIALFYRAELAAHAPEACDVLDRSARQFGEAWVVPQSATVDMEDEVTVEHAAELVGRTTAAIHKWINRDGRLNSRRDKQGRLLVV